MEEIEGALFSWGNVITILLRILYGCGLIHVFAKTHAIKLIRAYIHGITKPTKISYIDFIVICLRII